MTPDEEYDTRKAAARLARWLDGQKHLLKKQFFYESADITAKGYEAAKRGKGNVEKLAKFVGIVGAYKSALDTIDIREKYPAVPKIRGRRFAETNGHR
jgi:hypothetical protein